MFNLPEKVNTLYFQCGQEVAMETFKVEIQFQHLLQLLLFSFQTAALKHLSCHSSDRFWQNNVSQYSSLCQWLKALLSAWRAAGRRLCDRPDFHIDQSSFACSLPSRWCHLSSTAHTWIHANSCMKCQCASTLLQTLPSAVCYSY